MNTSKIIKPSGGVGSKIPVKRPVPVSAGTRHIEPTTTTKTTTKPPVPTITQPHPTPPKSKVTVDSKTNDAKTQPTQSNKENKENISLNSTKKVTQDVKVKGYTELRKNEERLSEMVNKFEQEKQNHAHHILAIEQKHKEELRAKDEMIRNLQYQLEASQKRIQNAENELSNLQEEFSTVTTRNKTLESLLEEANVDVVALQRISTSVNIEAIELQFQQFKAAFELDYDTTVKCIKQKDELLACMALVDLPVELEEEVEEIEEIQERKEKEEREEREDGQREREVEREEETSFSAAHAMEVE